MESKEELLIIKRIKDLADRSYQHAQYTFTEFLTPASLSLFYKESSAWGKVSYQVFGGMEETERCMIRFGDPEELGYKEEFPIRLIHIRPLQDKFAEDINHRDFLGALMNLGIERDTLGDLYVKDKHGYVFAHESMSNYIIDNISRIRHTSVMAEELKELPDILKPEKKLLTIQAASTRIDGVVASITKLSRSKTAVLFAERKVFLNGIICENVSRVLKEGDVLSIRGYGKYIFDREGGQSKKGRLYLDFMQYV